MARSPASKVIVESRPAAAGRACRNHDPVAEFFKGADHANGGLGVKQIHPAGEKMRNVHGLGGVWFITGDHAG